MVLTALYLLVIELEVTVLSKVNLIFYKLTILGHLEPTPKAKATDELLYDGAHES